MSRLFRFGRTSAMAIAAVTIISAMQMPEARVLRGSQYNGDYIKLLSEMKEGDALIFDVVFTQPNTLLPQPPNNTQIIGGSAGWRISGNMEDVVFYHHKGRFSQTGGIIRRCQFIGIDFPSHFTGLDSVLIHGMHKYKPPSSGGDPWLSVNGFMRAVTILDFFIGHSAGALDHDGTGFSTVLLNATDPVGDGRNSLLGGFVGHGARKRTDIHIINGRGITVSNFNTEYSKFAAPTVMMENCAECVMMHPNPGGYEPGHAKDHYTSTAGLDVYRLKSYAGAVVRMGGQANTILAGAEYKSYVSGLLTSTKNWEPNLVVRDPFFTAWSPQSQMWSWVNLAEPARQFVFQYSPRFMGPPNPCGLDAWNVELCAKGNSFLQTLDGDYVLQGLNNVPSPDAVKEARIPPGPKTWSYYLPRLPELRAGLGEDMTGESGTKIANAVNGGSTVYLGPGTYTIGSTLSKGAIYGAGMGKTILQFSGGRAFDGSAEAHNLTVQGGDFGYVQTTFADVSIFGNVHFSGQSKAALTLGNAQQASFHNLYVENAPIGISACEDDTQPCGEDMTPGGGPMLDKITISLSSFTNISGSAIQMGAAVNGFTHVFGSDFNRVGRAIAMYRTGPKGKGYSVHQVTIKDCSELAITMRQSSFAENVQIENCPVGITGEILGVVGARMSGVQTAIKGLMPHAFVHDVIADGALEYNSDTWISSSKFSNRNADKKVFIGDIDISSKIDFNPWEPDATPPSKPGNIKVAKDGQNNVITWDPSDDKESGILQYIVAKVLPGAEIGRTSMHWEFGSVRNEPGKRTTFVDSNAHGRDYQYFVIAVNGARITSADEMDRLRLFPNFFDLSASDDLLTFHYPDGPINKYFWAVDYSGKRNIPKVPLPYSTNAPPTSVVERQNGKAQTPSIRHNADLPGILFDITGRKVATLDSKQVKSLFDNDGTSRRIGEPGIYWLMQGKEARKVVVKPGSSVQAK